jgi:dTDP-4-amino-4,6-dideoxygalactose transaminase
MVIQYLFHAKKERFMADSELPALFGGPPACPQGPPSWPPADDDVQQALQAAYASGSWGAYHGGLVERLEDALARYHRVAHAVTCASGTYAVELALRALKVGPGDEVVMAAYDYSGNFLTIHALGAFPILVDVAATNWNLDPERVEAALGPQSRAILASHLHGGVVPMRELRDLADKHGLSLIEDAAQMPGAPIQGRKAGTWGDAGILSFGGSKLLTAGRGGAVLTPRSDVHQRLRTLEYRGNRVSPLSELQAAVLLPQLEKLDARNVARTRSVQRLTSRLQAISGLRPFGTSLPETQPGYYKLGFQYDASQFGLSRARFVEAVRAEGVSLDEGFKALHIGRSPRRYRAGSSLTESDRAHVGTVVLHHPVLLSAEPQIDEVVSALYKIHVRAAWMQGAEKR